MLTFKSWLKEHAKGKTIQTIIKEQKAAQKLSKQRPEQFKTLKQIRGEIAAMQKARQAKQVSA